MNEENKCVYYPMDTLALITSQLIRTIYARVGCLKNLLFALVKMDFIQVAQVIFSLCCYQSDKKSWWYDLFIALTFTNLVSCLGLVDLCSSYIIACFLCSNVFACWVKNELMQGTFVFISGCYF
jgi:hypothetical protein